MPPKLQFFADKSHTMKGQKKCNKCLKWLDEKLDFDLRYPETGKRWARCIECKEDADTKSSKDRMKKMADQGYKYCKRCDQEVKIDQFITKMNGTWYVECITCRQSMGKHTTSKSRS